MDALFHAIDGNFTQNQKEKKTDEDDFPLSLGAAYFANEIDVAKYIQGLGPLKHEVRKSSRSRAHTLIMLPDVHLSQVWRHGIFWSLGFRFWNPGALLCTAYVRATRRRCGLAEGGTVCTKHIGNNKLTLVTQVCKR